MTKSGSTELWIEKWVKIVSTSWRNETTEGIRTTCDCDIFSFLCVLPSACDAQCDAGTATLEVRHKSVNIWKRTKNDRLGEEPIVEENWSWEHEYLHVRAHWGWINEGRWEPCTVEPNFVSESSDFRQERYEIRRETYFHFIKCEYGVMKDRRHSRWGLVFCCTSQRTEKWMCRAGLIARRKDLSQML